MILVADTIHLLVQGVRLVKVFRRERHMNSVIAQIIWRFPIRNPFQLQFVVTAETVSEMNDFKLVAAVNPADLVQVQCLRIKFLAPLQI